MADKQLQGKKLLILGASSNEITLVKRAQSLGVYTIVADYNLDYDVSPAKKIADEVWDVSWSDIDTLESRCRETGVNGVTAGYSEFRVENLIKLCKRLHLPCYINEEQLEVTRDKLRFKEECRRNGVPVVKEYACPEDVDEFPVIVKPVDRAGSIGISIATDKEELQEAYRYAMELSVFKRVIIEKYMQARKVDVYYAVENGEIQLISSCDTIDAKANGLETVAQSCWLYPMKEQDAFLKKADPGIRRMIQGMNIQYGCIFFSGFVDEKQEFSFFECGFRMEGAHQYNYVQKRGLFHFLDLFIWHALTGSSEYMERGNRVDETLKCAVLNFYAKEGTIRKLHGIEEISRREDCLLAVIHGRVGQVCKQTHAILPKVGVFVLSNPSAQRLAETAAYVYEKFELTDEADADMVFDRIDVSQIANWWSGQETWTK